MTGWGRSSPQGESVRKVHNLQKNVPFNLAKHAPRLRHVLVGLGWAERSTSGDEYDLDASLLGLGSDGRLLSDEWFIFYNQEKSPGDVIVYGGDNKTGSSGDEDDESLQIDLMRLPAEMTQIIFPVSIYQADTRRQSFGMVRKAYIRLVDLDTGSEVARYDLVEDASTETAMIFAQLDRNPDGWSVTAVQHGVSGGLAGVLDLYGVAHEGHG